MARKSSVQDLPAQYTEEYDKLIEWAKDLGRFARENNTEPDWKKVPDNLRRYTKSAYNGLIAQWETAA